MINYNEYNEELQGTDLIHDPKWDQYMDSTSWLNRDVSDAVKDLTDPVKNKMLLPIWNEFLSFQEGIATEVYDINPSEMIEHMGSVNLIKAFAGYLQGALDVQEEIANETFHE